MTTNNAPTCFSGWPVPGEAINSLMAELMEGHIRNHMPQNSKSSEEAAEDLIRDRPHLPEVIPGAGESARAQGGRYSLHQTPIRVLIEGCMRFVKKHRRRSGVPAA